MEDTAMKKIAYEKPSMRVVELQHRTCLLQTSQTPPNEIPDYDDWFGVKDQGEIYDDPFNVRDDDWSLE